MGKDNPYPKDLVLKQEHVLFVQQALLRLVEGYNLRIEDGNAHYETVLEGTTPKGVKWVNVHKQHQMNMMQNVKSKALPYLPGDNGVDIGCGIEKVKQGCIGIDSGGHYGDMCDADDFRDAKSLEGYEDGQFDWVFSSNTLEHIPEFEHALDEWVRVLRKRGYIFLYLPWPLVCKIHSCKNDPYHVWDPSPLALYIALEHRGVEVLNVDADTDPWGCFSIVGRKK